MASAGPDDAGVGPILAKVRDPLWDNVRFVAIVLVVVGHTLEGISGFDLAYSIYLFIYAFHVPLFVFVSGYFARAELTVADGGRMVRQLIAPYLIFSVLYALLRWATGEPFKIDLPSPWWHLWFLVALVIWRLSLVLLAAVRIPLLIALLIGGLVGYFESTNYVLDLSRTLTMLPFFVLGWRIRTEGAVTLLRVLRRPVTRVAAVLVLAIGLAAAIALVGPARDVDLRAWVQAEDNYASFDAQTWWAAPFRWLLTAVALVLVLCCMSLTPARPGIVSRSWGRSTMYVYLWHLVPIVILRNTGFYDHIDTPLELGLLGLAAVGWAMLLSTRIVRTATHALVEPSLTWLLSSVSRPGAARPRRSAEEPRR